MNVIARIYNWVKSQRLRSDYYKSVVQEREEEAYHSIKNARESMNKLRETLIDLYGYDNNNSDSN